jgi:hypothetical protein
VYWYVGLYQLQTQLILCSCHPPPCPGPFQLDFGTCGTAVGFDYGWCKSGLATICGEDNIDLADDDRSSRLGSSLRHSRSIITVQLDPLPHRGIRYCGQFLPKFSSTVYLDVLPRQCSRVSPHLIVLFPLLTPKRFNANGRYPLPRESTLFEAIPLDTLISLFLSWCSPQLDCQLYLLAWGEL